MKLELKTRITNSLKSDYYSSLISSEEYYFQKAKDVLDSFLKLDVDEYIKDFLLLNRKDYDKLKSLFQTSNKYQNFGNLIFELISYCDSRADRKKEFNRYEDNRTLAMASVRMNHWVEHLISYKFENVLKDGSIKNALEYLLNPLESFTMLSENHRTQISENLFNRRYSASSFKDDFINFFSDLSIKVKNPLNYTHLLTRISYDIISEWKESIIGLICPDGTGWQENVIDSPETINYLTVWNHRKPNIPAKTINLLRTQIEENGFFKIFYSYDYNVHYVAEVIDFVTDQTELTNSNWNNYENINWDGTTFSNYNDESKTAKIIYLVNKFYRVSPINESNFIYYANKKYPSVGSQAPVISYITNEKLQNTKKMNNYINLLKYKKQIILQGPPGTGKTRLAKGIAKEIIAKNFIEDNTFVVKTLTKEYIKSNLNIGQKIEAKNNTYFEVIDLQKNIVLLKSETSKPWRPSYNKIIDSFNNKLWEIKGRTGGFKSYEDAVAKYFYDNHFELLKTEEKKIVEEKDFLNIIQFHPSYTYEDFVRGIVAKPNDEVDGIIYEGENKTLVKFAENALADFDNKYVLIIDEINRANLSSVLGELIYALEYRDEEVESMYEVDGFQKLVLPKNLFIIGTMNTADRSVGHIDYAIRRRFAFVDVLPKELNDDKTVFHKELFRKVSELFIENYDEYISNEKVALKRTKTLSGEFKPEDVWLGHSYFIQKKLSENLLEPQDFSIRIDYEIKPILLEYVKDGILIGKVDGIEIEDYIKAL